MTTQTILSKLRGVLLNNIRNNIEIMQELEIIDSDEALEINRFIEDRVYKTGS